MSLCLALTSLHLRLLLPCCSAIENQQYILASPTRSYIPICRGDVVAPDAAALAAVDWPDSEAQIDSNIRVLQSWTAMGGTAHYQVYQLLYPLDGKFMAKPSKIHDWQSDGLSGQRMVAFDMRLAELKSLDVVNEAYSVRLAKHLAGYGTCLVTLAAWQQSRPHLPLTVMERRRNSSFSSAG